MRSATEILGTKVCCQPEKNTVNNSKFLGERITTSLNNSFDFLSNLKENQSGVKKDHNTNIESDMHENITNSDGYRQALMDGQYFQSLIANGDFVNLVERLADDSINLPVVEKIKSIIYKETGPAIFASNSSPTVNNKPDTHLGTVISVDQKQKQQVKMQERLHSLTSKPSMYHARDFSLLLVKVVPYKGALKVYIRDYRGTLRAVDIESIREKLCQGQYSKIDIKHNGSFRRISGYTTN